MRAIDCEAVAVLHPPVGERWWAIDGALACADEDLTWLFEADGARLVRAGPVIAAHRRDGVWLLAVDGGPRIRVDAAGAAAIGRSGLDQEVRRGADGWEAPGLALPVGARMSAELRAWPEGRGVSWRDGDALYACDRGGVVAVATHTGPWAVLRDGWHLLLRGEVAVALAAPWRAPRELPRRLLDAVLVGDALVGQSRAGRRVALRWPELRPEPADDPVAQALAARGWRPGWRVTAADDTHVAGPGGAIRPLDGGPAVPVELPEDGAACLTRAGLATLSWPDGDGRWLDRHTGAELARFRVRLRDDDPLTGAFPDASGEGAAVFVAASGRGWRVERNTARRLADVELPEPPPAPVPLDGAHVGRRVIGWRQDGLVIAL